MPLPPGADPAQSLVLPQSLWAARGGRSHLPGNKYSRWLLLQTTSQMFLQHKREQKDSGKLQNVEHTKTWVSFDKSAMTSRRKSGHCTRIYLLVRQQRCCKAQILTKWPFPHLTPSNPTISRPKWNQQGESLKIVGLQLLPTAGFVLLPHATFSNRGCTNWGLT